jgi:hypothetical protein
MTSAPKGPARGLNSYLADIAKALAEERRDRMDSIDQNYELAGASVMLAGKRERNEMEMTHLVGQINNKMQMASTAASLPGLVKTVGQVTLAIQKPKSLPKINAEIKASIGKMPKKFNALETGEKIAGKGGEIAEKLAKELSSRMKDGVKNANKMVESFRHGAEDGKKEVEEQRDEQKRFEKRRRGEG